MSSGTIMCFSNFNSWKKEKCLPEDFVRGNKLDQAAVEGVFKGFVFVFVFAVEGVFFVFEGVFEGWWNPL